MRAVAARIQGHSPAEQTLILARLAQDRTEQRGFAPVDVERFFDSLGLPRPTRVSNQLATLERQGLVARRAGRHARPWQVTPAGRERITSLFSGMELAALAVEERAATPDFAGMSHPLIPPEFAPPHLIDPLRKFLDSYPFETNVFGMTRFPGEIPSKQNSGLIASIAAAREACTEAGLTFHLASDRQIVDDLWGNVAAHMWACPFGVAFFETRSERGLNYNLTIEVGGCIVTGRRLALLKDSEMSEALPSDLVGHIYKSVNLDEPAGVKTTVADWIASDLSYTWPYR